MDIKISHSCPSCGGEVELNEADRLTKCMYCDVQNYMVDGGLLRFVLPDKVPQKIVREDIIYFPYLRFKGNIFSCQGSEIGYKVLDTTHQGITFHSAPPSLGLKPQAMKVAMVNESHVGKFIRRKQTAVKILQRASQLAKTFSDLDENAPLYHRAFIGETVSCIYLPIYIDNGKVYDGVLNRVLGKKESWMDDGQMTVRYRPDWAPRFLATICPQCGAVMNGSSDSLVLHCYSCHSCWSEKGGKFVPVPFSLVAAERRGSINLPFWRIKAEAHGVSLSSMAHFLKLTNQPVVIREQHQDRDLEFWIPAFKIRPKIFLKVAKSATLSQLKFPEGEKKLKKPIFPVTMPLKEATQAMKSVIAETSVNRKDVLPKLPSITFKIKRTSLAFLPFEDSGHDLIQEHSALSIAASVAQYGRKL